MKVQTVDGFGKDARAGRLTDSPWAAEQICLRDLSCEDGILQRGGEGRLTYDQLEVLGSVFSCGNDIISHVRNEGRIQGSMGLRKGGNLPDEGWVPALLVLTNLILLSCILSNSL